VTLKDIKGNWTRENLVKLKKGYFCQDDNELDYDATKKRIRTNKLFGLTTDVDIRQIELPPGI